jgi:tyramine---L-glutamate ligase
MGDLVCQQLCQIQFKFTTRRVKVAVLEFLSGGGISDQAGSPFDFGKIDLAAYEPLYREGLSMLAALATDLSLSGHQVRICLDGHAFSDPISMALSLQMPAIEIHPVHSLWLEKWIEIALQSDRTIVIAPELDYSLQRIVETIRLAGAKVIAPSSDFLNATSDKLEFARLLHQANVPHPTTQSLVEFRIRDCREQKFPHELPLAMKRRDGAGCSEMKYFHGRTRLVEWLSGLEANSINDKEWIVQQWRPGTAASMALVAGGEWKLVGAMRQEIALEYSIESKASGYADVSYQGGSGPIQDVPEQVLEKLASQVRNAIPGAALGWLGIDFVIPNQDCEVRDLVVIEVNPRLTTSYLGYRQWHGHLLANCIVGRAADSNLTD